MPFSRAILKRLFDLFPADTVKNLPQFEEDRVLKGEAIDAIASVYEEEQVVDFVVTNFGRLHQHVYVFERSEAPVDPSSAFGVPVWSLRDNDETHHFYFLDLRYDLWVEMPDEEDLRKRVLEFAWPIKVVFSDDHVRIHVTIMNKSPGAYLGRGAGVVVKYKVVPEEQDIVQEFYQKTEAVGIDILDLNKGVKALWGVEHFDAPSAQHKRPKGTSKNVMDAGFTIKKDDPELYREIQGNPLFGTTFQFAEENPCITTFFVDPTNGSFRFRRYSTSTECIDRVIRSIIQAN